MKRILFIMLLQLIINCQLSISNSIQAQTVSRDYHDCSMSKVLIDLNHASDRWKISFVYNELEDFTVTKHISNRTIPDAIRECIGFYPINISIRDSLIFVECTQKAGTKLIGHIVDEQGNAVPFANVSLLSPQDSCFITGGVSNENGDFVVPCDANDIIVRVSYVGYKTHILHTWPHDVGTLRMQLDRTTLGDVTVTADIPRIELHGSSISMNVAGTLLERIGTAEDVIARAPLVMKNGDSFEVIGKGRPVVYINGRQVRNLLELRNLQSDHIKNIEVVQNPGARYDATVSSVIIIRTKRPVGEGLGVEINSYTRGGENTFKNNERLNLTYRKNGLELFLMGFGATNNDKDRDLYHETSTSQNIWTTNHHSRNHYRNDYFEGKLGFNYQIGDNHSFGAFIQNSYDKNTIDIEAENVLQVDGTPYDHLSVSSREDIRWKPCNTANAYYNGKIGNLTIDFNSDYIHRKGITTLSVDEKSTDYDNRNVNTDNLSRTTMAAEKLVLGYPVLKGQLTFGEEFTSTKRINSFANAEGYLTDSENQTRERNIAPFMELQQQLGKVNMNVGLRYEHTSANFYVGGIKQEDVSRSYDKLFPSASIAWSFKIPNIFSKHPILNSQPSHLIQMQLSYATRTRRPVYDELNSNVYYENRFNLQEGNKALKPSYVHNLSFMAMMQGFFLNAAFSRFNDDIFFTTTFYNDDPKINLVTFVNYPHREQLMLMLGMNKQISLDKVVKGVTWMPQWSGSFMKQWFTCDYLGEPKRFNSPLWMLQLNNVISFPDDWLFTVDFQTLSKGNQLNSYLTKYRTQLNVGVSKDFFDKRLNVKLAANDVFKGWNNNFVLYSNQFLFDKKQYAPSRFVYLQLRYRLNVTGSKYKGTGAGNAEKGRL